MKNSYVWLLLEISSWNWYKLTFIPKEFNFSLKNRSLWHQYQKQWKMFFFYFMVCFPLSLYSPAYNISLVWWEIKFWKTASETWNAKYLELIKRWSKVQEKNMSCEGALNFDHWKTFSENYKPFSPSSFKLIRGILPLLTKYVF